MRITILGGSFDPPHNGHVAIASQLLKHKFADQVWLIPCYQHPFNKNLSDPNKRLKMTKYLEENSIKASPLEIDKKVTSFTIDTLRFLANKYPKDEFCWIIGTDQIKDFTKWRKWRDIVNEFKLIIVPRVNFKKSEREIKNISKQVRTPENIILIDAKEFTPVDISSTLIRERIKKGQSISSFVPKKIEEYIIKNKLYR